MINVNTGGAVVATVVTTASIAAILLAGIFTAQEEVQTEAVQNGFGEFYLDGGRKAFRWLTNRPVVYVTNTVEVLVERVREPHPIIYGTNWNGWWPPSTITLPYFGPAITNIFLTNGIHFQNAGPYYDTVIITNDLVYTNNLSVPAFPR